LLGDERGLGGFLEEPALQAAGFDEMGKVADQKKLVYCDAEITLALTILKGRELAINAAHGCWSTTSKGSTHAKITPGQARELTTQTVRAAKERARKQ
jgi:hypothetical protein